MRVGLLGRKIGMTQIFQEDGTAVPITVLECGPCTVLQVRTDEARAKQAKQGIFLFKLFMGAITGISLLVGGIGIMNVLLAAVAERTREIGIRKATGARQRDILAQFLAESVAITGLGSAIGFAVGLTGALGIMRKSAPRHVLVEALRAAARGEHVPSTEWASALDTDPLLHGAPLTAREREVLALYASGLNAREVGARLFVSENTVNDHLRRIRSVYAQIGRPAATKVELYQRGIEDGFVPAPSRD